LLCFQAAYSADFTKTGVQTSKQMVGESDQLQDTIGEFPQSSIPGGGTEHTFWKNAHLEGLERRVELQNVDARQMPFDDQSFDVIVSTFTLHHIGDSAERERALREMVRVLKPGGTIALADLAQMIDPAADFLRRSGISAIERTGRAFVTIIGRKV